MAITTRPFRQRAPHKASAPAISAPAKAIKTHYTLRFTGWQLVYGLRQDLYLDGFASQRDLGCIDALTAMPGGAVRNSELKSTGCRYACEVGILREGL